MSDVANFVYPPLSPFQKGLAGVSLGTGIVGSLYNAFYNRNLQDEVFRREDTAYQRAVKDAIAAGFSPLVAAGTQGGGVGQIVSQSPVQTQDVVKAFGEMSQVDLQNRQLQIQEEYNAGMIDVEQMNADTDRLKALNDFAVALEKLNLEDKRLKQDLELTLAELTHDTLENQKTREHEAGMQDKELSQREKERISDETMNRLDNETRIMVQKIQNQGQLDWNRQNNEMQAALQKALQSNAIQNENQLAIAKRLHELKMQENEFEQRDKDNWMRLWSSVFSGAAGSVLDIVTMLIPGGQVYNAVKALGNIAKPIGFGN